MVQDVDKKVSIFLLVQVAFFLSCGLQLDPFEYEILQLFFNATEISNSTLRSDPCSTVHIQCEDNHVIQIDFAFNGLSGSLPESLGLLPNLLQLNLSSNTLSGPIPQSLFNHTLIQKLDLSNNAFTGTLPEYLNMPSLLHLDFNLNTLGGTIPTAIGYLTQLQYLSMFDASLAGSLPLSLTYLTLLTYLDFGHNELTGVLPDQIGALSLLLNIKLDTNQISGTIPASFGDLSRLTIAYIHNNQFSGTLPPTIKNLKAISSLYINENNLNGAIPSEIGDLENLQDLHLESNDFVGTLPETITKLSHLVFLNLNDNALSGTLPYSLDKLLSLQDLNLSYNNFTGSLPDSIGSVRNLQNILFDNNNFHGTLPQTMGNLASLQVIQIRNNNISGTLPQSLRQLSLSDIYLNSNQLEGNISLCSDKLLNLVLSDNKFNHFDWDNLDQCTQLFFLDISNNNISRFELKVQMPSSLRVLLLNNNKIPNYVFDKSLTFPSLTDLQLSTNRISRSFHEIMCDFSIAFPGLLTLDLSFNQIEGSLLPEYPFSCSTFSLATLVLDSNQISGNIISILNIIPRINSLSITSNRLSGTLPDTMGAYVNEVTELYLNLNLFSGTLPKNLPSGLKLLNLEGNQLVGTIPEVWGNLAKLNNINLKDTVVCGCIPPQWETLQWESCIFLGIHLDCSCNPPIYCSSDKSCNPSINSSLCGINQCQIPSTCNSPRKCIPLLKNNYYYGYKCSNCNSESIFLENSEEDFRMCIWGRTFWLSLVALFCLLALPAVILYIRRRLTSQDEAIDLPYSWFWDKERLINESYQMNGNLYYKRLLSNQKEYPVFQTMIDNLDFGQLKDYILEVYSLAPLDLARSTAYRRRIMKKEAPPESTESATSLPTIEEQKLIPDKKYRPLSDRRQAVLDMFMAKCALWDWNEDKSVEDGMILPVVHGTSAETAWAIARSGFASLSLLDSGFYGTGMYFSTSAKYTTPYFGDKKDPAVLICLSAPGRPYPVVENPNDPKVSLKNKGTMRGYDSHYCATYKNGLPIDTTKLSYKIYDELVLPQEAQVVPMFLVVLDKSTLYRYIKSFQADLH